MPHRREQIMDAVVTAVTGLTTTGTNVFRGRAYPLGEAELPGLLVYMGGEEVVSEQTLDEMICVMEVAVVPMVAVTADPDQALNLIAEESTVALAADYTLALPGVVYRIEEIGADEPEIAGEGETIAAAQRLRWQITYRRNRTDPT
jgi:hypothetical protein